MADRDSERDRRVRELMSDASKKKDQLAALGQSQAEIQDIQSELQNHLAMQQAQDAGRLQETGVMSQAAGMMMASQGDQLQGQVAAMNPGTQAMMGKYGVKPKKTQSSSHNQNQSRVISKSGDITNIKNETITNNHTDIRVTQPAIPKSQPVIPVAGAQKKEDGTAKFKAWLSGMFAKQQNDAEIQKKEYRKKEWNLGRTTTRLMKRIENATTSLGAKLDPKNMTSTLGGQIKWLLLIFSATMMAKFWKPTMKFLANLEGGFKAVFGLPMNDDLRNASSGTLSVIDQIKDFIGIKKGENESLIGGIGKVFMEGVDKLINKLKFWFEDRASALKDVEFPELKVSPIGIPGFDGLMDGLTGAFKGVAQYLGDIITIAMGGSKGKVKVEANKIARQAQEVFTNTSGKQTSAGDAGLVNGKGRNYMRDSDYDMFGNLKSNASSTQAMSRSLISMFNDKSGKAHTAEIGTGVGQLFDVAKRNGQVVIDPELLDYLGLTKAEVMALQRNKQLRQEKYRIIGVKPTTDAQRKEMGQYSGNVNFWGAGLTGTAAGAWAGAKLGMMAGGTAASVIPGLGTAVGTIGGGIIGGAIGAFGGGLTGSAIGAGVDAATKYFTGRGLYPKLVKADSGERGADGSMGVPKMMWTLTKEGADQVAAKFTQDMTNTDMDLTNKEFYEKIRKIEERKKRQNGVQGALTQNLQTNNLNVAQSQYDAFNKQWYENFESNDPNSRNMQNYGHYNSFIDNTLSMLGGMADGFASALRNGGNYVARERLTSKEQDQRAVYVMQRLIQEGLTPEQAAGIAGNIMKESGFRANVKVMDNNHKCAGGLVGWNGNNLAKVEQYFGKDIRQVSFEDQVGYLIKELKGEVNGIKAMDRDGFASRYGFKSGANVLDVMKRTGSAAEAAMTYERIFEGSGDFKGWTDSQGRRRGGDRDQKRMDYATKFLGVYNGNPNMADGYQSRPLDYTSGGFINFDTDRSGANITGVPTSGITDEKLRLIIQKRNEGKFYSPTERQWIALGYNDYKSKCTSGPSTFYEAGGIKLWGYWWNADPPSATQCRLERAGLKKIWNGPIEAIDAMGPNQLRPGDIGVLFGYHYGSKSSPSSHGMMWDGRCWVSDTVQEHAACLHGNRLGNQSAQIFRYPGFWDDESSDGGNGIGAGWLGDSQSCVAGGLFPMLVGQGLGCSFRFYARGSANASHYLGTGSTQHLSAPSTNIEGFTTSSTCKDALDWMIKNKPKYCFIELGHNGMSGYQNLVDQLRGAGIKVICIKMWATNAKAGTGMKSYTQEQSANLYNGISADIFVDLSHKGIPLSSDGVHASKEGCQVAAREVLAQLNGAGPSVGGEDDQEFMEVQDGLFGKMSGVFEEGMDWLADKFDGSSYQQSVFSEDITAEMTDAQKKVFNSAIDRIAQNEALNIRSWESLGAKSDDKGTYFQNGDIRTYVRTDEDHNGIFGLRQEDIAWVERVDSKGRPGQAMTDSEVEIASKAATYSVSSMFSDYPEKTKDQGYNDYMVDKNGKPLGFFIGEFKDIDSFKDPAPEDFNGKIRFWIFPTKDLKRWNMIGIGESRKCSLNIISETRSGTRYYGPIIYHKGARWFVPGTFPSEKKYTDYQPICHWLNVKLTPSARIAALGLIDFLNTAGNITEKDGKFYNAAGKELTKEELQKAKDYGIITKTDVVSEQTGDYLGRKDTVKAGFSQAMTAGKALDVKSFKMENYSSGIGIENTKEAREKYYNEHKDLFRTIDGTLYGPQNIKWGTVDSKGKISLYDNDKFKSTVEKEGEEGLTKNSEAIINYDTEQLAKVDGFVSREKMAKFIFGASNYTGEGSQIKGREKMRGIRGVRNIKSGSDNIPIQYTAFIRSDGTPYSYRVTKKQLIDSLKAAGFKSDVWDFSDIKATNLSELDQAIINSLNNHVKSITDRTNFLGSKTYKATSGNNTNSNKRDGMARLVLNKGKEVVSIRNAANGQEIVLEDGEVIKTQDGTFGFSWGKPTEDTTRWINDINNAIKLRNKQLKTRAINDSFEKSGMNSLYKSFAESANKGELKYKRVYGNYVATDTNDVFGVVGKDGKVTALNGGQAYEVAMNYFNQTGIREDFYRKALGSKTIQGKDYYEIESNGKKQRIQIDLSKDLSNFIDKGLSGLSMGQAQEFQNGKWVTLVGEANAEAMKNLTKPLDEMRKNQGFTNTLMKQFKDAMAKKLSDAAKNRVKQLNAATEQKAQQKQSNVYLEQIAKNGISRADLEALTVKIGNIKFEEETEKQANKSFTNLAEQLKAQGKNLNDFTVVGDAKRKYVIGIDQLNKVKQVGNGDGKLSAEEEAKGGTDVIATDKFGNQKHITIINEGGKYFIHNSSNNHYSGLTTDGTLAAYETN